MSESYFKPAVLVEDSNGIHQIILMSLASRGSVTILQTIVFCVLALTGTISGADFLTVFTVVIAFYFGTQSEKNAAAATYTGPQQSGETVAIPVVPMTEAMDAAVQNDVHPPDLLCAAEAE